MDLTAEHSADACAYTASRAADISFQNLATPIHDLSKCLEAIDDQSRVILQLLWGFDRELAAHLCRVLVGIEAGKQMQDPIWQFHDGFNPGSP